MDGQVRELKKENERLKRELAEQRAVKTRAFLAWDKERRHRNHSEEFLLHRTCQFAKWFSSAAFPMTQVGADGLIEDANHSQLGLLGYSRHEYVGHPLDRFISDHGLVERIVGAADGEQPVQNRQATMQCKSGVSKAVQISSQPVNHGRFRSVCCYVQDLSEVIESRSEQQKSESLFRQLTENIEEVFWMTTCDKKQMLYVSPSYEKIWGRSRQSLARNAMSFLEGIHPEDRERVKRALPRQSVEGAYCEEYRVVRPDGSVRWLRDRAFPVRDEQGQIYRIAGLAEDITAGKIAQEALHTRALQDKTLAYLGRMALIEPSLPRLLDETTERLADALGVEFTKVLQFNPRENSFSLLAGTGWKPELVGKVVVTGHENFQAGYTLTTSGPVIVEDLGKEPRFKGPPLLASHGVVSGMSVVIEGREHPFGILGAHTRQRRRFTQDDANFLQSVAHVVAAAIERRDAEKGQHDLAIQLARHRQKLENILQHMPAIYWELRLDPETCELRQGYTSEFTATMIGYSREECIETPDLWQKLIHPEDRERVARELNEILARQTAGSTRFRWLARDNRVVWVESTVQAFPDEYGRPLGLRGVALDITARKMAEAAHETTEERFRAFMDNSPVVAVIKDEEGRYIYGNRKFHVWCKKRGVDWQGHTDHEIFPENDARRHVDHDRNAMERNTTTQTLEIAYDEHENPVYWDVLRFPVTDSFGSRSLGTVAINVTERRRLEKELLEISDREQQRFGQELHDGLCQHLLGIAMMSKTLSGRMKSRGLPEAQDVQNINDFLDEALCLARGLMRGLHLVNLHGKGNLSSALDEFAHTTSKLFDKRCHFQSDAEIDFKDSDVATHLFRIAQEATHNGIKHGEPNQVTISLHREGDDLCLQVENDGKPLPEPSVPHTGIGLRTMQYRADLIAADLQLRNRPEGGVLMTCRIPTGHGVEFTDT